MDQLTVATHNQKLEFWLARICDCRASGMSVADWCNTNDIGIKTYYYWMRKIKREAFESLPAERKSRVHDTPVTSPFVEVPVPQDKSNSAIRVHLSQAVIDISDGTSGATITEVLTAVSQLC